MYVKSCPSCGRRSFSADLNSWTCPYCGNDLNDVEAQVADGSKKPTK